MTDHRPTDKGMAGWLYTGAYLLAMIVLYVSERLLYDSAPVRISLALTTVVLIAVALGGRILRIRMLRGTAAVAVERRILLAYLVGFAALLLYAAQADFVMEGLRPLFAEPRSADRFQVVVSALWVTVWICAVVPLIFIELSYAPMDTARTVELRRIAHSVRSGLIVAMTAATVFLLNFVASELNEKADLGYFKTTEPSESSNKMVANLTETFEILLFFPNANEVLGEASSYFEDLARSSKHIKLTQVDHVMEPKLAKELGASDNGTVVFKRGKRHQQLVLGKKLTRAKSKLKTLDAEFQKAFLKLMTSRRVAYFTVGHEERAQKAVARPRSAKIRDLRKALSQLNYTVKDLGIAQGLGSSIPTDATVVIIAGPRKPFMAEESQALVKYLRGGGRALVLLDPETGVGLPELLGPFGLEFHAEPLAVSRPLARRTQTKADRQIIVTNRFGTHTSVNTLSRHSSQLALVFLGSGYLTEVPSTTGDKPNVHFTVHAMPATWNDINSNFELDGATEKRADYELAAAVTMKGSRPPLGDNKKAPDEMRMVVVADSDVISDGLLFSRAVGNRYLLVDAIKWLGGEEKFIGETTNEEDVRIAHTQKKDEVWFYLTIFGVPALVLASGLAYTQRRRKHR